MYGDFINKEKRVHSSCFVKYSKDLILALSGRTGNVQKNIVENNIAKVSKTPEIYKNVLKTLKDMGENVTIDSVKSFGAKNPKIHTETELILAWLDQRNVVKKVESNV